MQSTQNLDYQLQEMDKFHFLLYFLTGLFVEICVCPVCFCLMCTLWRKDESENSYLGSIFDSKKRVVLGEKRGDAQNGEFDKVPR